MNYSAFEQAAAEASLGAQELEIQIEQLQAQMEQLRSKRELLRSLSHQLGILRSDGTTATSFEAPPRGAAPGMAPEPAGGILKAEPPQPEGEAATAGSARSLREGWGSLGSDSAEKRPSLESIVRGRT